MSGMTETSTALPKRRRAPPRVVTVAEVARLTPGVVRIVLKGEELAGFGPPRPGSHIKLFFPPDGFAWPPSPPDPDAPRPPSRTYTPLRFDRDKNSLEVEFVLHGDGLASNWAQTAKPGDTLTLAGPGGGYELPEDARQLILLADDTAIPAASTILQSLPETIETRVLIETTGTAEIRSMPSSPLTKVDWLPPDSTQFLPGERLQRALAELADVYRDAHFWIACEAMAMRRLRQMLIKEHGIAVDKLHTRGYWRAGQQNYPDHDYGKD